MNLKEYKADLELETGEKLSMAAARALYSQYLEHEAEAIAGGRDDIDPELVRERQCAIWAKMAFQVYRHHIRYCIHTDAMLGNASIMAGGFKTRDEAQTFVDSHYTPGDYSDDEVWFSIYPSVITPLPARMIGPLEEVPF